ncbi:UNVERIFIED_CONTAM: hypothetical protein Sradi_6827800 [Sesamum radiatum]|uniref:Endonuclease/exonuclease/phosphatase domain-containing protein n=1 Tax=Sesamum radiatum TaxID=300843 RepID=A0AAW2JUZ8_SESRA
MPFGLFLLAPHLRSWEETSILSSTLMRIGGATPSTVVMLDFHDAIANCALMDAGYIGSPYTWYSRRLQQCLDRILVSGCWMDVFPKMQVAHLELSKSDHHGLLVEAEHTIERKASSFQF